VPWAIRLHPIAVPAILALLAAAPPAPAGAADSTAAAPVQIASDPAPLAGDIPSPIRFTARDNPGDSGGSILLTWTDPDSASIPAGSVFEIRRAEAPAFEWKTLAEAPVGAQRYMDATAAAGHVYRYEVRVKTPSGAVGAAAASDPASAHDNWFRFERTNSLVATIIFLVSVLGSIAMARSGKPLFIRRIAGLSAVDEAIGRATETGKKVLYVPGIQSMDDIQTLASMSVLGHVARVTARFGTDLDVANRDPLTFAAARETVRGAYLAEGRPDLYREEMVNYVTYDQFAFVAAVSARMVRERPAANFLIGYFFAESLILAETGQSVGAIQIAGQADPTQLPFFVATCDYVLIGEELYAASAYLSREPVLLGSIRGQDIFKALCIVVGLTGIVMATLGNTWIARMLQTR
jgi:hypothetical protein